MSRFAVRCVVPLAALGAAALWPRVADAQDATSLAQAAETAAARASIEAPRSDERSTSAPPSRDSQVSLVMQSLYVSTALVQGLDANSTFKALNAGAVESNSLVKPFASNRPAFVALKVSMSAAFIYAGHDLSRRHKIGAIIALSLVNSLYTAIALHNYHVAHVMDARR
jgi:hypothetical protein